MNKMKWIVAGAESGLGKEIVVHLLQNGCYVAAIVEDYIKIADLTSRFPHQFVGVEIARNESRGIASHLQAIIDDFASVDGVILCDSTLSTKPVEEMTADEIISSVTFGLTNPLLLIREIIPYFRYKNRGKLILVSSIHDKKSPPDMSVNYAISRGVESLFSSLTDDLSAFGIETSVINFNAEDYVASLADKNNGATSSMAECISSEITPARLLIC